ASEQFICRASSPTWCSNGRSIVRPPYDLIFPTDSGKPQALNNFRAGAWLPLMEEAGLIRTEKIDGKSVRRPMYSPYALRHYYASKLIGKDLNFIQNAMGHSKIEITLNVYGHLLKGRAPPPGRISDSRFTLLGRTGFLGSTVLLCNAAICRRRPRQRSRQFRRNTLDELRRGAGAPVCFDRGRQLNTNTDQISNH